MAKCTTYHKDVEEVAKYHEVNGHNINHSMRNDLIPHVPGQCEDCRDDILEDLIS